MAALTFVEPEDPLGAKHFGWQLVVEKVLEFAQGKGAFGRKGERRKPFNGEVIRPLVVRVVMGMTGIVGVAVVMAAR